MAKKAEDKKEQTVTLKPKKEETTKKVVTVSNKKKLSENTLEELIILQEALKIVIEKYEKIARQYTNQYVDDNAVVFHKYVKMYNQVVLAIEKKIMDNVDFENE